MKYNTLNLKKKYNTHKTHKNRSFFQKGGEKGQEDITTIIKNSNKDNLHIISPQDTLYPQQYIGFTVFVPSTEVPFSIDQLITTDEKEGTFVKDGKINVTALDKQIYLDSNRSTLLVNHQYIYNSFKEKVEQDKIFVKELLKAREQKTVELFTEDLKNIFKKLKVDKDEYESIYELAEQNSNSTTIEEFWAIIPYFDEILNSNGIIKMDELNRVKLFCQQSISKTILDLLMRFVSFTNTVSHGTFFIGGLSKFQEQNLFGSKSTTYISQIPSGVTFNITIKDDEVVLEQKLYQCLININNEFGLAVIDTTIYVDVTKNQFFFMWKIDRWRNNVIKKYYHLMVDMNEQGWGLPETMLVSMNENMCNNLITDDFPKSQDALLDYFKAVLKYYIPEIKMVGGSNENESQTTNETVSDEEGEKVNEVDDEVDDEVLDNEVLDNEVLDNEVVNNEVLDNEVKDTNEVLDNEVVNNEVLDNELVNNEVSNEVKEEVKDTNEVENEVENEVDEEKDEVKEEEKSEEPYNQVKDANEVYNEVKEEEKIKYNKEQIDNINKAINTMNEIIKNNYKTMSDNKLKNTIQSETNKYLSIKKRIKKLFTSKDKDEEIILDTTAPLTNEENNEINQEEKEQEQLNELNQEEKEQLNQEEDILSRDSKNIDEARDNLEKVKQQYNDDLDQVRNDQPPVDIDENLTNTLATAGSIAALGAIGTGMILAAPLLLGGGITKKHKKLRFKHKNTIKHKQ